MAGRKRGAKPPVDEVDKDAGAETDGEGDGDGEPEAEAGPADGELEEVVVDDAMPGLDSASALLPAVEIDDKDRSVARRDPLTAYVQEIRRYPLLTREQEHELAAKYFETGDPKIAATLVTANLRLVVKIAHEYRRAHRNLLDLVQEGNIGLMQAVKKYDPFRGVKLSSYAAWWIRAYILKFILNNWRLVKIGTTQAQRKLFFNLRKEKEKLERLGFEPEHKLLAERMNVSEAEVADMDMRLAASEASLDAPIGGNEDGPQRTRGESMAGSGDLRPDVQVEQDEFRRLLREKLATFGATLEGREKILYEQRWLTDTPQTLQEIGDKFGISRERARQIEKRLLDRLRKYLEAELGSAVDIGPSVEE